MGRFFGVAFSEAEGSFSDAEREDLLRVLRFLRPKPCPVPLTRIGGDGDGAYLLPQDLDGIVACFSPGVSNSKDFEDALYRSHGIGSHMCDFTSDLHRLKTPLIEGAQSFEKKWLDVDGGAESLSLADWVSARAPGEQDLILQIDIEGAEYRNLLNTPREVLRRFRIIVMELHGLARLNDAAVFRDVLRPFFLALEQDFVSVHAHPNNCAPQVMVEHAGMRVPQVLELTLLRKDRIGAGRDGIAPQLPHPLDLGRNVRSNPPEFLDDSWLDGPRPVESELKRLRDELDFAQERRYTEAEMRKLRRDLRAALGWLLARTDRSPAATLPPGAVEIAEGRPFMLDAAHAGRARRGVVRRKTPFFFHTALKVGPRITIDLQQPHHVDRIVVTNRSDGLLPHRAAGLFAVLHLEPEPDGGRAHAFALDEEFLSGRVAEASLTLPSVRARHVTLTSPLQTALHFANVRVFGTPAAVDR